MATERTLEERLQDACKATGESVDAARSRLLAKGLDANQAEKDAAVAAEQLRAHVLLVTTRETERKRLCAYAKAVGLPVTRLDGRFGRYWHLGVVGSLRVAVIEVEELGPFSRRGSASRSIHARAETGAHTLILVGTAFGVRPEEQRVGDVIVSDRVLFYDRVNVADGTRTHGAGLRGWLTRAAERIAGTRWAIQPAVTYPATAWERPTAEWVNRFARVAEAFLAQEPSQGRVMIGTLLSGGARIESGAFRDKLVAGVPASESTILGGEMEAAGLVAASWDSDHAWIVVKGVSDFADAKSRGAIRTSRVVAAEAAARVVLCALASTGTVE